MNSFIIYLLIAIVVVLCIKSLLSIAAREYLEDFYNDPTGGIVPVEKKKNAEKE